MLVGQNHFVEVGRDADFVGGEITQPGAAAVHGVGQKRQNLALQLGGNWRSLFSFSAEGASVRRESEFFYAARALTWWLVAIPAVVAAVVRRRVDPSAARAHGSLLAWIGLTGLTWCGLMFVGGHAVIHQGSYAMMLALFVLFSAWLEHTGRWLLPAVAVLQAATLATTYALANVPVHGAPVGLPVVLLTALLLASAILTGFRADPAETSSAPA